MEGLIDCLKQEKWKEITPAEKVADDFVEVHVNMHAHKKLDDGTFVYMVENDNIDPRKVILEHAIKDPIKKVALIELKLSEDGTKILGMDLDGDIVIQK